MSFSVAEQGESTLQPDESGADAAIEGAEGAESTADVETGGAEPSAAAEPRETREERQRKRAQGHRERTRDLQQRAAETDRLREENERTRLAMERLTRELSASREEAARSRPQPKNPNEEKLASLVTRRQAAAARLATDPNAYKEWESLGDEITDLRAELRADRLFEERMARERQNMPRQVPPDVQRLASEFTWLSENADARAATELEIKRLAARHRRDLSNPSVRFKTMREAAANVAAQWGLDPGYEQEEGGAGRFGGPGGKTSAPGAGGAIELTPDEDKMAQARALFPNDDDEVAWKKWVQAVGMPVMQQQKKSR